MLFLFQPRIRISRGNQGTPLAHYSVPLPAKALFSLGKILDFATVALSFVYGKYYPIID